MTEAGQVGTLGGKCRKHALPEGTTVSQLQSFVILEGCGEARDSYLYIKCYSLEKKKRKKKKTQCASHKVHWPFNPQICNLRLGFYFNVIIYFSLFICRENYTEAWIFEVSWELR